MKHVRLPLLITGLLSSRLVVIHLMLNKANRAIRTLVVETQVFPKRDWLVLSKASRVII